MLSEASNPELTAENAAEESAGVADLAPAQKVWPINQIKKTGLSCCKINPW
jgi:hypothetical protein